MSHCISVYLINKSDLRNSTINSVIDGTDDNHSEIVWTELKEGILLTTDIIGFKKFRKDKMVAKIRTDYFGGIGCQSAKVFENGKKILNQDDEYDSRLNPINSALKLLGVVRKGNMDEFDTIGLGSYRNNRDF